jgi:hypothetical protein
MFSGSESRLYNHGHPDRILTLAHGGKFLGAAGYEFRQQFLSLTHTKLDSITKFNVFPTPFQYLWKVLFSKNVKQPLHKAVCPQLKCAAMLSTSVFTGGNIKAGSTSLEPQKSCRGWKKTVETLQALYTFLY